MYTDRVNTRQVRKPAGAAPPATLEGILERITYVNEESAWSAVRLSVRGRKEPVTAVGNLLGVQPGESVRPRGRWTVDRTYGERLAAWMAEGEEGAPG